MPPSPGRDGTSDNHRHHHEGVTIKAALLVADGQVRLSDDRPEPFLARDDVLVRVGRVGICGSDLDVFQGKRPVPRRPWVMGHEAIGRVVAVGAGVGEDRVGQLVAVEPNYPCLACAACHRGLTAVCPRKAIVGITVPGLLAERVAVPARFAWPAPAGVDDMRLLCAEPMAVAGAALRRAQVPHGADCLVIGGGSAGLFLYESLAALGASVTVVEPHPGRRELAASLGATVADSAPERRFEYVFESSGVGSALAQAPDHVADGGTLVLIGLAQRALPTRAADLARRLITVTGSIIYDHPGDFEQTLALLASGKVHPEGSVVNRVPFDDAQRAFRDARRVPGKTWIDLLDRA